MPEHLPEINVRVDLGAGPYTIIGRSATSIKITDTENGFATASVDFHKPKNTLLAQVVKGAPIAVFVKSGSESAWPTRAMFRGKIRFLKKGFGTSGTMVTAKCDGSGYGFAEMLVGCDYGVQSSHGTIRTLKQIVTDASFGIVPAWVQKIRNGSASGYTYDTSSMDDIVGDVPYLYFPYKPASKALNDALDIVQAIKYLNPGPHWMVTTDASPKLLVTPVANHSAAAIAAGWPTYVSANVNKATLIEGRDFHNYTIDDQTEIANYVLYESKFQWPGNGDVTETYPIGDWAAGQYMNAPTYEFNALPESPTVPAVGVNLLKAVFLAAPGGQTHDLYFRKTNFLHLDLTKAGGLYSIPSLSFWAMKHGTNPGYFEVDLCTDDPITTAWFGTIAWDILCPQPDKWYFLEAPVGPYWSIPAMAGNWTGWSFGAGNWADFNWLRFRWGIDGNAGGIIYLDGLKIAGWVLRGAKNSTLIGASQAKMRVVSDNYAKGDTLIATDDSGTVAMFAKAELLRQQAQTQAMTITTRLLRDALAGQLLHVKARPVGGVFAVDVDFRITKLVHEINDKIAATTFNLTDDVVNSQSRAAFDSVNSVIASYRPEFQDRQATGTKLRDIDITQTILEKDYP